MNKLQIKGQQEFLGFNIPVIEGGFGEGKKVILAKTVSEIHGVLLKKVNQLINDNIDEFEFGVDIIDLKSGYLESTEFLTEIFNKQSISNSKNIYLLSEQGYMTLVMLMRTDKAKEIRKQLRTEYFTMREIINSDEQLKAMALLKAVESNNLEERLNGITLYSELKVKEAVIPLQQTITDQAPKVESYNQFIKADGLYTFEQTAKILPFNIGRNTLCKILRDLKILQDGEYYKNGVKCMNQAKHNVPYQLFIDKGLFECKVFTNTLSHQVSVKTHVTPKGVEFIRRWIIKRIFLINNM